MPTSADTLVAALREWLDNVAGGGPFGSLRDGSSPAALAAAAALLAPPSRRQMLDRYSQHTLHCAACRLVHTFDMCIAHAGLHAWATRLVCCKDGI